MDSASARYRTGRPSSIEGGKMAKVIIGIVILAIIALVAGLVPIMEVPYTEAVQYQDTETYFVDEPYDDIEVYYDREPYEVTETYTEAVPLTYEATSYVTDDIYTERYETIIPGLPPMYGEKEVSIKNACVDVKNTDDIAGIFTIRFAGFRPLWEMTELLTRKLEISPGEVKTAVSPADSDKIGDWSYSVEPSTKEVEEERTVTKYREVEKERTITKYRQVEKEKPVTKERLETRYKKVPIFEYLFPRFNPG